jgi:hypothetical protein
MLPEFRKRKTELMKNGNFHWFVCCKQKKEMANSCLFAANGNGKRKFVFLSRQTINGNRRLVFQQTCPSMPWFLGCTLPL